MNVRAKAVCLSLLVGCASTQGPRSVAPSSEPRTGPKPSAPFRAAHVHVLERLEATTRLASELEQHQGEARAKYAHDVVRFFVHELLPHAEGEEHILYRVADDVVTTSPPFRYTDVLRYEHTVVASEVKALHASLDQGLDDAAALRAFQQRVYGLAGLVRAHFGGEENVVLEALDARMTADEFRARVMEPTEAFERAHGAPAHAH